VQAPTSCGCERNPADRCLQIQLTVVDLNAERIDAWNDPDLSQLPVYEPGLFQSVPDLITLLLPGVAAAAWA
jgi:hypothetical protein